MDISHISEKLGQVQKKPGKVSATKKKSWQQVATGQ